MSRYRNYRKLRKLAATAELKQAVDLKGKAIEELLMQYKDLVDGVQSGAFPYHPLTEQEKVELQLLINRYPANLKRGEKT